MAEETGYQGWSNYETWNANLWIDNEQASQQFWLDAAKNATSESDLADRMKNDFRDAMPELTGVWSDLLTASFGEVDWYEIAKSLMDEVKENQMYKISQMVKAGATSSDSCKLEDIVAGIEDILPEKMLEEFEEADEDEQSEIFEDICDYLDEIAPEGLHFGTQEGDGACYGFWKTEEEGE
uniref:Uncharacterized protein n=1 Tax=Candidatus Methanogaster sp. ANME-2c ERB4 TaxID=2759911 RepID=A0A7G9Y0N4_9EURY|nr:hypothetical protein HEBJAHIM_00009 [Methanosarcinales archaeon ANME-2c ERB4]QNO42122.1 hypothetical protein INBEEEIC_00024 [Methanosarcinales archaeon ANME-2c ERB4]QNO42280.1 hypothetical protein CCKMDOMK_00009 [Methanosarcinales archaeon ANME-2c ERB4]QNO42488.1 hypothetical protein LBOOMNCC_00041 [Methanosarcinales archaeon ANME-2c ERB4]QNO42573.1 hypothetical protein MMDHCPHC_00009 [Methanosarcinales archaeon ANME-2c ERB4]